jgi:hypothetical protein
MLIDAAVDGQGVALARAALAAWDLFNARLDKPFDLSSKLSQDVLDRLSRDYFDGAEDHDISG